MLRDLALRKWDHLKRQPQYFNNSSAADKHGLLSQCNQCTLIDYTVLSVFIRGVFRIAPFYRPETPKIERGITAYDRPDTT